MTQEEKIKKAAEKVLKLKVIEEDPIFPMTDSYGFDPDKDKLVDSKSVSDRLKAVSLRYGIEKLKDDSSYRVRLAILRAGYFFNSFINDPKPIVRRELAKTRPKLVKDDPNPAVRREALKRISNEASV